jgi:hypothetical protein
MSRRTDQPLPWRVDEGCLLVGERVVVWSDSQVSLAAELVADVRSGSAPRVVRVIGGESREVPAVVAHRCAAYGVWLANSYEALH